jgi:hypothetical protein
MSMLHKIKHFTDFIYTSLDITIRWELAECQIHHDNMHAHSAKLVQQYLIK